jgi:hypothetical protein
VLRRQLNYRDWPNQPPREKGIDVSIAVDLMHLAFRKQYDALVLFSSDTDLLPALKSVVKLRLGRGGLLVRVQAAAVPRDKPPLLPLPEREGLERRGG